ncbi:hypothetical protein EDE05_12345 [Neorhizobium sp. R1-B]|jgi:hypothetical protein|uniref:hypothetical protein n=1 Tax=Neorhizobium TaxID=1525371 RepID=UPI0010F1514E|nr:MULTISPECIES: hypothetical protein [Neorhizobium]TCV64433.1 hypothetical protein EDE09_12174 [Neorhizobium sp. S3-V5DH]TDX74155.1 hypothetical protein EDE05_12345 [Neorhizobium sp. R1-B]
MFDPLNLVYYALICGFLAAFAPNFGGRAARAGWGLAVGAIAVFLLPWVRSALGF